jgi:hypothetical protein
MATRTDINETFDPEGRLISSETVEVEVPAAPDMDTISQLLNNLSDAQRAALVAALTGTQ